VDRLAYAQWVLERNLHWIAAVETKTAVVISVDLAMLGALGVAFGELAPNEREPWAVAWGFFAAVPLAISMLQGALAVLPQVGGPDRSLIFFGKVALLARDDYSKELQAASEQALLQDCIDQAHRNAEIAKLKYERVTLSLKLALVSIPFWLVAVFKLVQANV
jgi:hypothetical protein